jgi:class 3 adenylate cyclase
VIAGQADNSLPGCKRNATNRRGSLARIVFANTTGGARERGPSIKVRVGLHTGEIELHGDEIGGIAVHIAQRVQALAQPDEVLVSRTVTDLVGGSGIAFADRGTHALKGVPDQWQLFAVEDSPLGSDPADELVG